jgi:hypothetical protein
MSQGILYHCFLAVSSIRSSGVILTAVAHNTFYNLFLRVDHILNNDLMKNGKIWPLLFSSPGIDLRLLFVLPSHIII